MALNFKTKLYSLVEETARSELLSPIFCVSGDTYAELRLRLENGSCVDWPFQFWDFEEQCRIRKRFEAMNPVTERVYVIPVVEEDAQRLPKQCRLQNPGETGNNDLGAAATLAPPDLEFPDADEFEAPIVATLQEAEVGLGCNLPEVCEEEENLLKSELISNEIIENYKRAALKLTRELESMDFADHLWKLKSYDQHGVAVVKILCGECNKEIGGAGGDHSRTVIQNLFANFKKSHLHSALHIKQWCKRKEILYSDHPKKEGNKSKPLILTSVDHRRLVEEGVSILQSVNDSISTDDPLFVVVGDVGVLQLKSFWYKVRCKIDGEIMLLCPPK